MPAELKGVVITGCGVVSPLGLDPGGVHARLCAGETASAPITAFYPTPFPARVRVMFETAEMAREQALPINYAAGLPVVDVAAGETKELIAKTLRS